LSNILLLLDDKTKTANTTQSGMAGGA